MNKRMTYSGIGPKLGAASLPYLTFAIFLSLKFKNASNIGLIPRSIVLGTGFIILGIGIIFYFSTVITLMKEFKKGKLITHGTYSLCRNPIYASVIVFFIPAAALIANSWIILTVSLYMYIMFKLFIEEEVSILEENFGDQYLEYKNKVNELFPFFKLW